ncbi:MAG: methionyl-tRNA formyltransferase [Clostridia bacterium]|nr:methionyl-tRNA formyltransferase [Clostridia bacterium]
MRIVFMGTPQYSVMTLAALFGAGHDIAAVFAQPDKPIGRKQILTPPATKVFAEKNNIPVYQPVTLRDGTALEILKEINPDIIVVVAYGKILPKEILDLPTYGCINGHASLLPKLRGASPIQWAIVTGEKQTGVSVMQMDEGMDTGDILSSVTVDILSEDNSDTLFKKLAYVTADLICKTVTDIGNGEVTRFKQDETKATYAPIIKKEMAHIDFQEDAEVIFNGVRGFFPWPVAFCFFGNKRLKIISAQITNSKSGNPGEVVESGKKLVIACGNGTSIELLKVQPEGGKVMSAVDFMRGNPIPVGTVLS